MVKERTAGKGFTLAEILITLTVIGVVAALTIPTLLQNTNQAELIAAWKKTFGDIAQARLSILAQDSTLDFDNSVSNSDDMKNDFAAKLNYIKSCNANIIAECWHSANTVKTLLGNTASIMFQSDVRTSGLILNNGIYLLINRDNNTRGWVMADVNGAKPPNTLGKDIFITRVTNSDIQPFGSDNEHETTYGDCSPPTAGTDIGLTGLACSAYYLDK